MGKPVTHRPLSACPTWKGTTGEIVASGALVGDQQRTGEVVRDADEIEAMAPRSRLSKLGFPVRSQSATSPQNAAQAKVDAGNEYGRLRTTATVFGEIGPMPGNAR